METSISIFSQLLKGNQAKNFEVFTQKWSIWINLFTNGRQENGNSWSIVVPIVNTQCTGQCTVHEIVSLYPRIQVTSIVPKQNGGSSPTEMFCEQLHEFALII